MEPIAIMKPINSGKQSNVAHEHVKRREFARQIILQEIGENMQKNKENENFQ